MTGWKAVQRGVKIDYDLEKYPLKIKTDSPVDKDEHVYVFFYTAGEDLAGEVYLHSKPPSYSLEGCTPDTDFPPDLPSEINKVWTITRSYSTVSGEGRVVIQCNGKEVVNVILSDTTCYKDWREKWSGDVEKIEFKQGRDDSGYYRPGKYLLLGCIKIFESLVHNPDLKELNEQRTGIPFFLKKKLMRLNLLSRMFDIVQTKAACPEKPRILQKLGYHQNHFHRQLQGRNN